jgi:hypothetical protein
VVTGEETDADIDSLYYLGICTIQLSVQRRIAILHYPIRHLLRQDNPGWCVQLVAILSVLIWAVQ